MDQKKAELLKLGTLAMAAYALEKHKQKTRECVWETQTDRLMDEGGDLFLMRETLGYGLTALRGEEVETGRSTSQ